MEYFSGSLATTRLTVVVGGPGENSRVKTNQGQLLVRAKAGMRVNLSWPIDWPLG